MPNNRNHEILVNEKIFSTLNSDTVNLQIGCMTAVSQISTSPEHNNNHIYINPKISGQLLVPSSSYNPYFCAGNVIKLGPSVGILTSLGKKQTDPVPKGKTGKLFKQIISYGQKKGLFVFVFYVEDVNWKKKTVKGYSITNNGRWFKGTFALPTIIYNRIRYRSVEAKSNVRSFFENLKKEPEVFIFNSRFLNKWEVNEVLWKFEAGQKFIPETKKFNRENLRNLLRKYPELFLKPINSSRGQGIVKVVSNHNGTYRYSRAEMPNPRWYTSSSFYTLSESLSRIGVRENRYLIQQGIDLAKYDDRVFDLRTQVQKDGEGKWVLTGVGVRVAGRNKFVTHIPNGGTAHSFDEVIDKTFGRSSETKSFINQQLKLITKIIPPRLEEGLGINLAIISLDIGIDTNGNLWILEVNSKPESFDEVDINHRHLDLLTDYFIFAAQKIAKRNDY